KQDVLAMCALQFASKVEQRGMENMEDTSEVTERLKALDQLVTSKMSVR
ncbi:MAG: cell division protein ZapA, partial [Bacteroidetes bacterium]